jgi:hypothetical protein
MEYIRLVENHCHLTFTTNFMGHNLAIIFVQNLLFIGSYGIDTKSHSSTCIVCTLMLCALFRHECHIFVRIV